MIICQAIYSTNFIDINPSKKYSIDNKYVYMIASGKYMIKTLTNVCLFHKTLNTSIQISFIECERKIKQFFLSIWLTARLHYFVPTNRAPATPN